MLKLRRRLWVWTAFLGTSALLVSLAAGAQQPPSAASTLKIPLWFDLSGAMTALYGNYDPATQSSSIIVAQGWSGTSEKA
jgi:hypothetical protein